MDLAVLDDERAARLEPPAAPRSHWEIAKTMRLPDGLHKGERWDPETEPVQVAWVHALDAGKWTTRTRVAPSQRGKSLESIALPLIRTLTELCQNAAYIMPNLDKLNQNWEGKVRPLMEGCGFGAWFPDKGPSSRGGCPAAITLRHPLTKARAGTWYFMAASGGGKETSLSSVTALLAAVDEGDDFDSDGHLKLGQKRTASFGEHGQFIATSTVNVRKGRDGHPILAHYDLGTRSRLWFQCPHCAGTGPTAGFQVLDWEHVRGLEGDTITAVRTSVRYICDHCQKEWTESDRKTALVHWREVHGDQTVDGGGRVSGPDPLGTHYSLLSTDLDYNMSSLPSMAEDWWVANRAIQDRGDHSLMRVFYHKRLCRDYTADLEELEARVELNWQSLLKKAQQCKWGPSVHTSDKGADPDGYLYSRHHAEPPTEAAFACGGVDVQNNRVYTFLVGASLDGTTYDVAWSYERARQDGNPWDRGELFQLLDRVDIQLRKWAGNLEVPLIGLDTGDFTDELNDWLKSHRGSGWRALMGVKTAMKDQPGDLDGLVHPRDGLLFINPHSSREMVHGAYRRPNHSVGAAHIPNGLSNSSSDTAMLKHLCAEQRVFDPKTKKERIRQGPGRWDWLDARRYAEALIRLHLSRIRKPRTGRKYGTVGTIA